MPAPHNAVHVLTVSTLTAALAGLPCGSDGKESARQCRRPWCSPWVRKAPCRREWHPTPVFLPGESHGQRRLAGYSPWGQQGQIWQKQLSVHAHIRSLLSVTLPDAGETRPRTAKGRWPQGVCGLAREEVQKTHSYDARTQGSSEGGPVLGKLTRLKENQSRWPREASIKSLHLEPRVLVLGQGRQYS